MKKEIAVGRQEEFKDVRRLNKQSGGGEAGSKITKEKREMPENKKERQRSERKPKEKRGNSSSK